MITLRRDQQKLKNEVYNEWQRGARNVLAVAVTGFGKSVVTSDISLDAHKANEPQAVIAHRQELVSQMSLHIGRRGIPHRIIGPRNVIAEITAEHRKEFNGHSFINPNAICTVAGVDTLIARQTDLAGWFPQIRRWTIDEAHHVTRGNKWGVVANLFTNAYGLGVTATPERADGQGLGRHADGVFDAMVLAPSMRQTIDAGYLTDYQIVVPESDFYIEDDAITATGDFSPKKMKAASDESHLVGDIVKEYLRWSPGKRGITFAIDVDDAVRIANAYNAAGVPAAAVSAKTPSGTRAEYIRRFRDGRLLQLVNVDLFGEGFDVPAVEVVSMGRPTASLAVYLQQFGRALRLMDGKPYGLIIDHVSNYKRHGLPDRPRFWTLDRREKRAKREPDPENLEMTRCRECSKAYEAIHFKCPYCGSMPPLPEPRLRTMQMVDGDLTLLDADALARMRAEYELEDPASIEARITAQVHAGAGKGQANLQYARIAARDRLDAALAQWAGIQRWKGRDDAESYRRIFLATGMNILELRSGKTRDLDKATEMVQKWCES